MDEYKQPAVYKVQVTRPILGNQPEAQKETLRYIKRLRPFELAHYFEFIAEYYNAEIAIASCICFNLISDIFNIAHWIFYLFRNSHAAAKL